MRSETCVHETAVLNARRSNSWDDNLLRHFYECSTCQDAVRAAQWIQNAAALPQVTLLPDPDVVWIRANVLSREREASRALCLATLRRILLYGPVSAGTAWLVLDFLRSEGVGMEYWLQASPKTFGLVPLGTAILAAALVYIAPSLLQRIRGFTPF
jgi:hypothetical protein